uniref:Uncharacterized protein n=1 Tax=Amphiprion percula TaxID=161767 RepID=A0A3P8U0R2_AMPPE
VPRCRYYDQRCVEMQSAPPLHPHPPVAPPPLSHPVTSIDCHSGFDFLLGQLHALIKHLEEFL